MKQTLLFIFLSAISPFTNAKIKLSLNWKPEPQFGGFYEAQFSGLFKKAGLDVEIIPGGSGTPTIQLLASGQTDYAIVSADEVILSHARGATNVVALFATYQTNPQALMTRTGRFKKLEDIFKNPGTLLWQSGLPYAQFLIKKYAPLKVKTAPYSGGIGIFLNDGSVSQQCFSTSEPLLAKKSNTNVDIFMVADSGFNPYTTVVVTTKKNLESHPEAAQKMVSTIRTAWQNYLKNPDETNRLMANLNKAMDLQTFKDSAAAQISLIKTSHESEIGKMTFDRWQALIDQLHQLKLIRTKPDAHSLFKNF